MRTLTEKAPDNNNPFERTMSATPSGIVLDTYRVSYHGAVHSHMDALCHYPYRGQVYNGYARGDAISETRLREARHRPAEERHRDARSVDRHASAQRVPYLEPGMPVFVEDIEAWEQKAGVKIGRATQSFSTPAVFCGVRKWDPGGRADRGWVHASVGPWIKARGVALVGSDAVTDVRPNLVAGIQDPFDTLLLPGLGVAIFDSLDLEAVAQTAARLNRWQFLAASPLVVSEGTGSPGESDSHLLSLRETSIFNGNSVLVRTDTYGPASGHPTSILPSRMVQFGPRWTF